MPAKVDSLAVHVQETSEGFSTTILLAETVADIPGGSDQASTVPVFFLIRRKKVPPVRRALVVSKVDLKQGQPLALRFSIASSVCVRSAAFTGAWPLDRERGSMVQ